MQHRKTQQTMYLQRSWALEISLATFGVASFLIVAIALEVPWDILVYAGLLSCLAGVLLFCARRWSLGIGSRVDYWATWIIVAIIVTSAMAPWYALRLLPILTFEGASVNLLDVLVACAVLVSAPAIIRSLVDRPRHLLWIWVFVGYVFVIPLVSGVQEAGTAFFAIREARPIAFYLLALALAAARYTSRDFRLYGVAYVGGVVTAIIAILLHFLWGLPLPGYQGNDPLNAILARVHYLDWTVPVEGFLLGLVGAIMARSLLSRLVWVIASLLIVWYVLASSERFIQGLTFGLAVTLPILSWLLRRPLRRGIAATIILVAVVLLSVRVALGPALVWDPVQVSLERWSQTFSDDSLRFRIEELTQGLWRVAEHPIFGLGLGAITLDYDPLREALPWRYISEGYGFLMIKTGLIGLFLYLGMVVTALRAGWRNARLSPKGEWPAAAVGVAGIVTLLAINVLYPAVDTPEGVIAFSLFYGMTVVRR